jgi:hypothetical protein
MKIFCGSEIVCKSVFDVCVCIILALKVLKIECDKKSPITDRIMTDGLRQLSLERFELEGRAFSVSL